MASNSARERDDNGRFRFEDDDSRGSRTGSARSVGSSRRNDDDDAIAAPPPSEMNGAALHRTTDRLRGQAVMMTTTGAPLRLAVRLETMTTTGEVRSGPAR